MIILGLGASTLSAAQVQGIIVQSAQAHGVPVNVALGIASHESQFLPDAQNSSSSAAGLFQLIGSTQQTLGVTNPYDPQQNTDAAMGLLASYYAKYGSWDKALQAFSEGPVSVNAGLPPTQQSVGLINYVNAYDPAGILAAVDPGGMLNAGATASPDALDSGDGQTDTAGAAGAPGVMEAVGIGLVALIGYMALGRG